MSIDEVVQVFFTIRKDCDSGSEALGLWKLWAKSMVRQKRLSVEMVTVAAIDQLWGGRLNPFHISSILCSKKLDIGLYT